MDSKQLKNSFTISLLKELCRDEEKNFVISPLGMPLAMLTAGLRGSTQTELLNLLGVTDEKELHSMYSAMLSQKNLPLQIATKILTTMRMEIHPEFLSLVRVSFPHDEKLDVVLDVAGS